MSGAGYGATMFAVYRDVTDDRYRVVFFTDLDETRRDRAIERALTGDHVLGGFLEDTWGARGREVLEEYVRRLNAGEPVSADEIEGALASLGRAGEG